MPALLAEAWRVPFSPKHVRLLRSALACGKGKGEHMMKRRPWYCGGGMTDAGSYHQEHWAVLLPYAPDNKRWCCGDPRLVPTGPDIAILWAGHQGSDWLALYRNGHKVYEGHPPDIDDALRLIGITPGVDTFPLENMMEPGRRGLPDELPEET